MTYCRVEEVENGRWMIKPPHVFGAETFTTKKKATEIATYLNAAHAMGRESAWTDLRHLIGAGREGEEE
ncbi:hypothetical protein [Rhizobium sp.]|uniref:hypothetical protein n=1 Tax=Rhizobium sp. TaxID=391 RepID=UPI003F7D40AC